MLARRPLLQAARRCCVAHQSRLISTEGLSIRQGPNEPALFQGTIPEHFASVVSTHGERPAIIARSPTPTGIETAYSYYELDLLSNRLASSLASLGVRKNQKIAVSLGNTPEFAALTYAAFKLGAILVPLNPSFNAHQVQSALKHLEAETLIMGAVTDAAYRPGRGRSNEEILKEVVGDIHGKGVDSEAVPSLQRVIIVDNRVSHPEVHFNLDDCRRVFTSYRNLLEGSERNVIPDQPLKPDDTINIQFTSGTTSMPKAAQLTHRSILNNGMLIASRMGLDPSDRIVVPPPLFHCFGCVLGYMATATTGSAILFPSPAFDPAATLKMCVEHDATGLYGVITMMVSIMEELDKGLVPHAPRSLLKGIIAGSSVPASMMEKIYQRLGLQDVVICYGMTETSPVSCMTRPSDPFQMRTSSVGTPMPHTTVKIVDPLDRSKVVPLGERGELAAAGYLVMNGYYGDPEKTAEVRVHEADGKTWMYSGDEAEMDANGYVKITGRIKDLIIRGGENIHPLEIENCLFQMPGIKEVSVVGVPDDRLGEAVAAFIVPSAGWEGQDDTKAKDQGQSQAKGQSQGAESKSDKEGHLTKDQVRGWVRQKLSSHLVPKHVFWVQEYPKTASGKIQKFKLADMAKEWLNEEKKET